ncbi:MAG: hypothetical protein JSS35_11020 [Proteobacteria bacterium]|nr:hypothetical protein [Pseudomonadota bacterium]
MILAALAAAVAVTPPPGAVTREAPMPNLFHQPASCRQVVEKEVERQRVAFDGALPAAQYAVVRKLDGCGVPTPVGYHPDYLRPGAATREDAPSNRR